MYACFVRGIRDWYILYLLPVLTTLLILRGVCGGVVVKALRYQPILLLAATVKEMAFRSISSTVAPSSSIGWQYLKLYVQLCAPDDGRRKRLKHVQRL